MQTILEYRPTIAWAYRQLKNMFLANIAIGLLLGTVMAISLNKVPSILTLVIVMMSIITLYRPDSEFYARWLTLPADPKPKFIIMLGTQLTITLMIFVGTLMGYVINATLFGEGNIVLTDLLPDIHISYSESTHGIRISSEDGLTQTVRVINFMCNLVLYISVFIVAILRFWSRNIIAVFATIFSVGIGMELCQLAILRHFVEYAANLIDWNVAHTVNFNYVWMGLAVSTIGVAIVLFVYAYKLFCRSEYIPSQKQ